MQASDVGVLYPAAQRLIDAIEVHVVPLLARELDVHDRLERHTHEQREAVPLGLGERLHRDVARDVVGEEARRRQQKEDGDERGAMGATCTVAPPHVRTHPLHLSHLSHRRIYLVALVPGQTTPWFFLVTGAMPLKTNFWRRFPSQVSVV